MPQTHQAKSQPRDSAPSPSPACPKKVKRCIYTPEDLQKAVTACKSDNPERISLQKAQELYGVPKSTISDALNGKLPRIEAHEGQQRLSSEEESILAQYCKIRGHRGDPVGQDELRTLAGKICGTTPGVKWIYAFAKRNPGLSFKWAQRGESKRGNGLTNHAVNTFFSDLWECKQEVKPQNSWNCDEKGFQANGGLLRRRVLVDSKQNDIKIMGDESRKMVTILECVSATGRSISPFIIHEGAAIDLEWVRCNPCGADVAASPNGWTDSDAAFKWLQDVFEPQTRPEHADEKRLLILDGHVSHCTLDLVRFARQHKIIVLCLPPHCTHRLQPLDVGVFGPLSKAWSRFVKESQDSGYMVTKNTFLSIYSKARREAMTEENIKSAFKRCGIHPFDRSKITDEDTAPAESTSCRSSQPLPTFLPSWLELESSTQRPEIDEGSPLNHLPAPPIADPPLAPAIAQVREPLATVPQNLPRIRHVIMPKPPPRYASHEEKDAKIAELMAKLEDDAEVIKGYYARLVLADDENGRLRNKLYGAKSKKAQVTRPSADTGRILTADKQFDELCRQDRKRAMKEVLKEWKPIMTQMSKALSAAERDWAREDEEHEKMAIKGAKGEMNEANKELEKLTKAIESAQKGLDKAEERRESATTPSTQAKENSACANWKTKLDALTVRQGPSQERFHAAELTHNILMARREQRLEELKAIEDRYQAAVAEEQRQKSLDDEKESKERARRAKLPQRPKDAATLWKDRIAALDIQRPLTKYDQKDVLLSRGTESAPVDVRSIDAQPINAPSSPSPLQNTINSDDEDAYIDPVLRELDSTCAASTRRRRRVQMS